MKKTLFLILGLANLHLQIFGQNLVATLPSLDTLHLDNTSAIIDFDKNISIIKDSLSETELIQYYEKGLSASQEIQNDTLARNFANTIRDVYYRTNDFSNEKKYAHIALNHSKRTGNSRLIAYDYMIIANNHAVQNELIKAIEYYFKIIELSKSSKDIEEYEYHSYTNLSYCFYTLGEFEQSISYLNLSEEYLKNSKDKYGLLYLTSVYDGIAANYMELENKDSSEHYVNLLIQTIQTVETDTTWDADYLSATLSANYIDITDYYLSEGKLDEAKFFYEKSNSFKIFRADRKYVLDIDFAVKTGDFSKAKKLINNPPKNFDTSSNPDFLKIAAEYYDSIGQTEKKLTFLNEYNETEVEKLKSQRVELSTYTKEKIATINQQKEIENLKQKQTYQSRLSYLSWGIISLMILSFILLLSGYFQIKTKNKLLKKNLESGKIIEVQSQKIQQAELQKNKLFTNIAHELQTPLNIIQGLSKQVAKSDQLTEADAEALQIIMRNSTYLSEATNQILSINLPSQEKVSSKFVRFSLPQLLEYLLPEFHYLASEKSITIQSIDQSKSPIDIYSDLGKISTILKNLLSNAIKYTNEKGTISIKYSDYNLGYHEIIVEDNGRGISKEELAHLFDRYYQSESHDAEGGFGLGLAICQEYIKSLNGKINVNSTLGVGSSFSIQIPIVKEKYLSAQTEFYVFPENNPPKLNSLSEPTKASVTKENRLLIVEDNTDFCTYLKTILKDEYHLDFLHNGIDALEYLNNNKPTLIITDWMMRGMDGLELVKNLKVSKKYNNIPILMLTARSLNSDKIKALRVGIDDYLIKPVSDEVLKKRIAFLLNNKEEQEEFEASFSSSISDEKGLELSPTDQKWLFEMEQIIFPIIPDFDLTLERVAKLGNTNSKQLNRKIKATTGLTAKKYIQEIRYWEARRMLETKEYDSVKAVCFSVGFKDQKNFSRKFKERFGVYPSQYLHTSKSVED